MCKEISVMSEEHKIVAIVWLEKWFEYFYIR
jgi:hypothetical protein